MLNISHLHWACILTSVAAFGLAEFGRWVGNFRIIAVGREAASAWAERKRTERNSRVSGAEEG